MRTTRRAHLILTDLIAISGKEYNLWCSQYAIFSGLHLTFSRTFHQYNLQLISLRTFRWFSSRRCTKSAVYIPSPYRMSLPTAYGSVRVYSHCCSRLTTYESYVCCWRSSHFRSTRRPIRRTAYISTFDITLNHVLTWSCCCADRGETTGRISGHQEALIMTTHITEKCPSPYDL
jgi:hypothetical protein